MAVAGEPVAEVVADAVAAVAAPCAPPPWPPLLRQLDLAAMMGGPRLRDLVEAAIGAAVSAMGAEGQQQQQQQQIQQQQQQQLQQASEKKAMWSGQQQPSGGDAFGTSVQGQDEQDGAGEEPGCSSRAGSFGASMTQSRQKRPCPSWGQNEDASKAHRYCHARPPGDTAESPPRTSAGPVAVASLEAVAGPGPGAVEGPGPGAVTGLRAVACPGVVAVGGPGPGAVAGPAGPETAPALTMHHRGSAMAGEGVGGWASSVPAAPVPLPHASLSATSRAGLPHEELPSLESFLLDYMLADGGGRPAVVAGKAGWVLANV